MKRLAFAMIICSAALTAPARDVDKAAGAAHAVVAEIRPGYIFPTNDFLRGYNLDEKKYRSAGAMHLKYSFRFDPDSRQGRMYPNTYQGVGVGFNTFFAHDVIGSPVSVYVFQGWRLGQLSPKLSLDAEWNFGVSMGWKKSTPDGLDSPNTFIGSRTNAYMSAGLVFSYAVNANWSLKFGAEASHYSNGNTDLPNSGLNTMSLRLGAAYAWGNTSAARTSRPSLQLPRTVSYDVVVYGAVRKKLYTDANGWPTVVPGRFGVVGLNFTPMYAVSNYFRAGASLDMQYDESANIQHHIVPGTYGDETRYYRPPFSEQFSAGLSLRGELCSPLFAVNFGIGYNLIHKGTDTKGCYQVLALKTFVTRHLFIHTGYMLKDFKDPMNLMLGVGWRF